MKLVPTQAAMALALAPSALCAVPAFAQAPETTEAPPARSGRPHRPNRRK